MRIPSSLAASLLAVATQIALSPIQEVSTLKVLYGWIIVDLLLFVLFIKTHPISAAILHLIRFNTIYSTTLILAAGIYRLFLHPLRNFPGPKLAALSKLNEAYLQWQGRNGLEIRALHQQYGDFVRVGPNEIAINNVDGLKLMTRKPFNNRGPVNEHAQLAGDVHLQNERDAGVHLKWRKIW
ncbi:hypothetical protein K440DRAFT_561887 [Wilcoxina mikolae CBS 423.85]|nr:hypothetical protein K440DRAFT_561887 [Wilcoxina mikolae CBS 423.85]